MLVKLNHVADLSYARNGAAMGVAWMGIQCAQNTKAYLSAERLAEIAQWVSGPQFVGELSTLNEEALKTWLATTYSTYVLQAVEVASEQGVAFLPNNVSFFYRKEVSSAADILSLPCLNRRPMYYVLSLSEDNWAVLRNEVLAFAAVYPVLLQTALTLETIKELEGRVAGLSIDSDMESRPGWQEKTFLGDILALLSETEAAD